MIGIGHVSFGIRQRQFHCLDLQVKGLRVVRVQITDTGVREDAHGDQRCDPLPIGRDFMQGQIVKGFCEGAAPIGAVCGHIGHAERGPMFGRKCADGFGQFAFVKGVAFGLGDQTQRFGQRSVYENLSRFGRPPAGHEGFGKAGLVGQCLACAPPKFCDDRGDQKSVFGIANGRGKEIGKRQLAKPVGQGDPGRHRSGDGDAFPSAKRHGVVICKPLGRPRTGGSTGRVQPMQFRPVPQNGKGVRAQPVSCRLHQRQRDRRRNGRIHRIPATRQHGQPGLGRQRMRGRDDITRQNGGAARGVGVCCAQIHSAHAAANRCSAKVTQ
mmetsp:Transcript_23331/g.40562  ORF Transcript_23331/g.40562 Transcript_23331/m.40562 type:complete len:325 (-) Transcript_23331:2039-3013(-)